jgi:hypothetical protein
VILPEPLDSLDALTWSVYADCLEEHQAHDVQVRRARRVAHSFRARAPKRVLCVNLPWVSLKYSCPAWHLLSPGPINWSTIFQGDPVKGQWLTPGLAEIQTREHVWPGYLATVLDFPDMHLHVPSLARAYFTAIARNVRL